MKRACERAHLPSLIVRIQPRLRVAERSQIVNHSSIALIADKNELWGNLWHKWSHLIYLVWSRHSLMLVTEQAGIIKACVGRLIVHCICHRLDEVFVESLVISFKHMVLRRWPSIQLSNVAELRLLAFSQSIFYFKIESGLVLLESLINWVCQVIIAAIHTLDIYLFFRKSFLLWRFLWVRRHTVSFISQRRLIVTNLISGATSNTLLCRWAIHWKVIVLWKRHWLCYCICRRAQSVFSACRLRNRTRFLISCVRYLHNIFY